MKIDKISALRALMKDRGIDAYIIPSGDAHSSEYVAEFWQTRAWFSGFTGSNGLVVITKDEAGLWTDGRYFLQAESQLEGSGINLFKVDCPGVPDFKEFLADKLPEGGKLGFDGRVIDVKEYEEICEALESKGVTYAYSEDLVGQLWEDRPSLPVGQAFEHEIRFAGTSAADKLVAVRAKMAENEVCAYLVTALDSIAWLMNIRGHDISFTPVVYAYALITDKEAHVFIDKAKVSGFASKLDAQGFTLHGYDDFTSFLEKLPTDGTLLYDPGKTSVQLAEALPCGMDVKKDMKTDIITALKAAKSDVELRNIRNAYIKESVALVGLVKWIKEHTNISSLTEGDIARKITSLRQEQADFLEDGFVTIAAYGANAAQAHYSPGPVGDSLKAEGFLLVDTGGQYLDGTTDTTRTIPIGPITDEMKRNFTLVLKGNIGLARAVFPEGTNGIQLDSFARMPLWEHGLNYRHGTGHGIGYCLGVHEGPQGISKKSETELEPGMLLSNEPAFYQDGQYGIRTENILAVVEREKTEYGNFYAFETLTFCPIDVSAIDISLMSPDEVTYLNDYHKKTYEVLAPLLGDEDRTWLLNETKPIG
ncbi:MAG: aminopeptidase P family protein [Defluviitaleaceae bacterium]|nr:aminopeptidase P family protein [Defluviitaleaceae bacterium]